MESSVVIDKPPEYHGKTINNKQRGFPFDEEEGGADPWNDLATRHPDIAARLRQHQHQHPATWARKRRPSSQDAEDFGNSFGGFAGFPFENIPPQFREHLPSHWNRSFGARDAQPQPQPPSPPQQQSAATQTERAPPPASALPQYGLRNTVDFGQKSPADPSLLGADERSQRSMSAPPESHAMSADPHHPHHPHPQHHQEPSPSNVRHIPIFVEGRDEPVVNRGASPSVEETASVHFPTKHRPAPGFYRPPTQPFSNVYSNTEAHPRGASPQRSQSPRAHQTEFRQVPVQHEGGTSHARGQPPPQQQQQQQQRQQQQQQQQQRPPQQQQQQQQGPQPPPEQPPTSPAKAASSPLDPITQILTIQTEVLNLMTEVENFTSTKKDKKYCYLDEMLTRNLIKLDNIETEGKENIRNARKEAIKCIHKCIAVLEAKAESNDVEAQNTNVNAENGEAGSKEDGKAAENEAVEMNQPSTAEIKTEAASKENPQPQIDTRPHGEDDIKKADKMAKTGTNSTKKKLTKATDNDSAVKNASKDYTADVQSGDEQRNTEAMQVDDKIDKEEVQSMDVDGATSQL